MYLLGDKLLIKTAIVTVGGVCTLSQNSLTKNFHSGVKRSQDRCQDKHNQIWVKPPFFVLDTIMTGNESLYVLCQ